MKEKQFCFSPKLADIGRNIIFQSDEFKLSDFLLNPEKLVPITAGPNKKVLIGIKINDIGSEHHGKVLYCTLNKGIIYSESEDFHVAPMSDQSFLSNQEKENGIVGVSNKYYLDGDEIIPLICAREIQSQECIWQLPTYSLLMGEFFKSKEQISRCIDGAVRLCKYDGSFDKIAIPMSTDHIKTYHGNAQCRHGSPEKDFDRNKKTIVVYKDGERLGNVAMEFSSLADFLGKLQGDGWITKSQIKEIVKSGNALQETVAPVYDALHGEGFMLQNASLKFKTAMYIQKGGQFVYEYLLEEQAFAQDNLLIANAQLQDVLLLLPMRDGLSLKEIRAKKTFHPDGRVICSFTIDADQKLFTLMELLPKMFAQKDQSFSSADVDLLINCVGDKQAKEYIGAWLGNCDLDNSQLAAKVWMACQSLYKRGENQAMDSIGAQLIERLSAQVATHYYNNDAFRYRLTEINMRGNEAFQSIVREYGERLGAEVIVEAMNKLVTMEEAMWRPTNIIRWFKLTLGIDVLTDRFEPTCDPAKSETLTALKHQESGCDEGRSLHLQQVQQRQTTVPDQVQKGADNFGW